MITSQSQSLLGTPYIPDDDEIIQIKILLSDTDRKLEEIDAEMSRIMAVHAELEKQHERIKEDIRPYRQFISISRRLPDYILQQLFLCCLPERSGAIMKAKEPPLVFTLVCHRWWQLALSTPLLWASFYVPVPPAFDFIAYEPPHRGQEYENLLLAVIAKRVERIEVWSQRAQECPLAITLNNAPSYQVTYCDRILFAVLLLAKRWKHLEISAPVTNTLEHGERVYSKQITVNKATRNFEK
ncbi:hypothetical protein NLJ89_g1335 [Agrocybe chaxingu]|uniref:F-box domain-containing protein n=1 Tax=Agrocybe chaxingu TaxID=84603 RepID=A0A9W8N0A5_9AGAR|nr:hypothetical protein NLJ89_g1335 [Agrocybe chaxingu]